MAAKKKALPEISVGAPEHADLVQLAKDALALRSQIAELTSRETEAKKAIAEKAGLIRTVEETAKGNYVGLIRITDADQTPSQVQFKVTGGALALEEGTALDEMLGSARPMLFEKDVAVTGVTNPDALIAEIRARNMNPWDFLDISVKKNLDRSVADSVHVTKEEAYLPKEGFLATLNEVKHTFDDKAKEYLKAYLAQVLKPAVDLGKK